MSRSTLTGLNTSTSEREYVALGVELGMRGDGRGRLDYRALSVQAGVLAQVRLCSHMLWRTCLGGVVYACGLWSWPLLSCDL